MKAIESYVLLLPAFFQDPPLFAQCAIKFWMQELVRKCKSSNSLQKLALQQKNLHFVLNSCT
jgi:hypothetical protein